MREPKGFEKFYGKDKVFLLGSTLYGLKQVDMGFWKELLKTHEQMDNSRSRADSCLYHNWSCNGSMVWLS